MKELKSHLRSYNTVLSNNLFFYETISKKQLTQTKIYDIFIMQLNCIMSICRKHLTTNPNKTIRQILLITYNTQKIAFHLVRAYVASVGKRTALVKKIGTFITTK